MDRRTLLAMVLCFLIFVSWQKLYLEKQMPQQAPQAQSVAQNNTPQAAAPQAPTSTGSVAAPTQTQKRPSENRPVSTSVGTAIAGDSGKFFSNWTLKNYRAGISSDAAVNLNAMAREEGQGELSFDLPQFAYLSNVQGDFTTTSNGVMWTYEDENIKLTRETTSSPTQPHVDLKLTAEFKKTRPGYAYVSIRAKGDESDPEAVDQNLAYWTNGSAERVELAETVPLKEIATPVRWVGTNSRYFFMTFVNPVGAESKALIQPLGKNEGRISLVYPVSSNTITIPLKAYFGPKQLDYLRAVDPSLDTAVDFGWFTIFAYPLLTVMKWFYDLVHNYGVAIILLTLLIKIATYPLTYKSMKSMKEMAKLQPQLQRLREKYKDDKEALNREMMSVMRSGGYNPLAGCLPILIQMPVFFALYRVLYSSVELYQAPFIGWIHDLSAKDPYYVTPIALTLTMMIQQKVTPQTATDPAQAKMMQLMPIIFGVFMISLPSGLTIYMLVNAITSIVQQIILNKKLDIGSGTAVASR